MKYLYLMASTIKEKYKKNWKRIISQHEEKKHITKN